MKAPRPVSAQSKRAFLVRLPAGVRFRSRPRSSTDRAPCYLLGWLRVRVPPGARVKSERHSSALVRDRSRCAQQVPGGGSLAPLHLPVPRQRPRGDARARSGRARGDSARVEMSQVRVPPGLGLGVHGRARMVGRIVSSLDYSWVRFTDYLGREVVRRCENVYLPGDKPEPPRDSRGGSGGSN